MYLTNGKKSEELSRFSLAEAFNAYKILSKRNHYFSFLISVIVETEKQDCQITKSLD
jgi:hypothetical protein